MKFKHEVLIDREIEIAKLLLKGNTLNEIAGITMLNKRHVVAHIRNMITKLKVQNQKALMELLRSFEQIFKQ